MIGAFLLGLAATAPAGPPAPIEDRRQTVFVAWDGRAKACMPRVNGVETGDIQTDEGKTALFRALPDHGAALHLIGATAVPYACTDAIVLALKHAGYYGGIALVSAASDQGR